jgi:cytochrome oxidase Cu insertion factor (SCO1/SenC/PrrC family)
MKLPVSIRLALPLLTLVCAWGCSRSADHSPAQYVEDPAPDLLPLAVSNQNDAPDGDLGAVGDFSLIERGGRTVSRADLHGKVWVASFLFTRCCTGCPQISSTLSQLQKELQRQPEVVLVSFSVDPEHDTPQVLKEYAKEWGADPERWLFLTGKQEEIYRLIKDSFRLAVQQTVGPARTPGNEVTHSTRLMVVDRRGRIRGWDFDGTDARELPRLRQKIETLLREKP